MRTTEADRYRVAYLAVLAACEAVRSQSMAIEGTSSDCCGALTYEYVDQSWCFRCNRMCKPERWTAARSDTVSRGGWDGGPVGAVTSAPPPDQVIYVHETRNVRRDPGDERWLRASQDRTRLAPLFDLPARAALPDWRRAIFAWDAFLLPGLNEWNPVEARAIAVERGRGEEPESADLWTRDNVQIWISLARRVVRDRVMADPGRFSLKPASRVASRKPPYSRLLWDVEAETGS